MCEGAVGAVSIQRVEMMQRKALHSICPRPRHNRRSMNNLNQWKYGYHLQQVLTPWISWLSPSPLTHKGTPEVKTHAPRVFILGL